MQHARGLPEQEKVRDADAALAVQVDVTLAVELIVSVQLVGGVPEEQDLLALELVLAEVLVAWFAGEAVLGRRT